MHCLATNVCVWVRTLVRESLKEINGHMSHYEKAQSQFDASATISDTFLHQVAEQRSRQQRRLVKFRIGY